MILLYYISFTTALWEVIIFLVGDHPISGEGQRIMKDELINVTTPERETSGLTNTIRFTGHKLRQNSSTQFIVTVLQF